MEYQMENNTYTTLEDAVKSIGVIHESKGAVIAKSPYNKGVSRTNTAVGINIDKGAPFDFHNPTSIVIEDIGKIEGLLINRAYDSESPISIINRDQITTKGFKIVDYNWEYDKKSGKSVMVECQPRKVKATVMKDIWVTSKDLGIEYKISKLEQTGRSDLTVYLDILR